MTDKSNDVLKGDDFDERMKVAYNARRLLLNLIESGDPEIIKNIRDLSQEVLQKTLGDSDAQIVTSSKAIETTVISGTILDKDENSTERAIDIRNLRKDTGLITYDPGFGNTGSCKSDITYMNGEKGVLSHRGIPIEELAERASFREVAYLLIFGKLPNESELKRWSSCLSKHSIVPTDIKKHISDLSTMGHPMGILSSTIGNLKIFYPRSGEENEDFIEIAARLISKVRTLGALSYKAWLRQDPVDPDPQLLFGENFLRMMFHTNVEPYRQDSDKTDALNTFLILHADHEQNLSTSTARMVASGGANIYASISAAINALWGPNHGGANERVINMLNLISQKKISAEDIFSGIKERKTQFQIFGEGNDNDPFRLPGFGHRVYKAYDPRARILKKKCDTLLSKIGRKDRLFELAQELEESALKDDYFLEHNLYPNVDFYSGLILKALGIPEKMFTVMFAIGRMPGWVAHLREQINDSHSKLVRPRQVYKGKINQKYIPLEARK